MGAVLGRNQPKAAMVSLQSAVSSQELCCRPSHAFFPRLFGEIASMPNSSARKAQAGRAGAELFENVTSPFCGTLPDDLTVERTDKGLKVVNNGCSQSEKGFERKLPPSSPQIGGKDVDLATAVKEAAKLIGKAKLPLYRRACHRCRRHARRAGAGRALGRGRGSRLERGAVPQLQDRAVDRLDHVDPDRGAQPRRSHHHRRQRHPCAPPPVLRAHRLAARTRCST